MDGGVCFSYLHFNRLNCRRDQPVLVSKPIFNSSFTTITVSTHTMITEVSTVMSLDFLETNA